LETSLRIDQSFSGISHTYDYRGRAPDCAPCSREFVRPYVTSREITRALDVGSVPR
jgi:hypothetical protein